jgi:hypothetical protein
MVERQNAGVAAGPVMDLAFAAAEALVPAEFRSVRLPYAVSGKAGRGARQPSRLLRSTGGKGGKSPYTGIGTQRVMITFW